MQGFVRNFGVDEPEPGLDCELLRAECGIEGGVLPEGSTSILVEICMVVDITIIFDPLDELFLLDNECVRCTKERLNV
jgi:hypothetical protein